MRWRLFRACGRGAARTLPVRRPLRQRDTIEVQEGITQDDIALIPLVFPMLRGAGGLSLFHPLPLVLCPFQII
jgi:small neutral amino acid transporter SnatA (MarC family)